MAVLLTRPFQESQEMASVFKQRGVDAYVAPLLEISYLPLQVPKSITAVLVTSQQAVYALEQSAISLEIPLICVGDSTAGIAQKAGYCHVQSAHGNSEDLVQYVHTHFNPLAHSFLYACGEVTQGNVDERLQKLGFSIKKEIVYKATPILSFPEEVRNAFYRGDIQHICVFSRRTATLLKEVMTSENVKDKSSTLHLIAFSPSIAEELNEWPWASLDICPSSHMQEFWQIAEEKIFR